MIKRITAAIAALLIAGTAQAATLTTGYAGGNGQNGNMFDIEIGARDIVLTGLQVNVDGGGDVDLALYVREGGYEGFEADAGAWTKIDAASGLASSAEGTGTSWDVADASLTAGGTYGLYVTRTDGGILSYTNGTAAGAVLASDASLTVFQGLGMAYEFGRTFAPRSWNGALEYTVSGAGAVASVPLPGALPLALAGVAALMAFRRRG